MKSRLSAEGGYHVMKNRTRIKRGKIKADPAYRTPSNFRYRQNLKNKKVLVHLSMRSNKHCKKSS